VFDLQFRIQGRETRPQMLQVAGPNDAVILLVFDLKVGDIRGMLNLCLPASVIESTGSAFTQGWHRTRREPTSNERQWLEDNLGRVPLAVTTTLEARLRARELVRIGPGDVLSLDIPVDTPVNIRIEDLVKFKGRLRHSGGRPSAVIERPADADAAAVGR
jgi:flagellar motor switch protein FliM